MSLPRHFQNKGAIEETLESYMTIDTKVWARLPTDQYIYFFRKIYAGDKGLKQELVVKFFTALYKECNRKGIAAEWDPNSYSEIDKLMANINFNPARYARRRAPDSPSKRTKEPNVIANDAGTVDGTSY